MLWTGRRKRLRQKHDLPLDPAAAADQSGAHLGSIMFGDEDLLAMSDRALRRVCGRRIAMIVQDAIAALNPVLPVGRQIGEAMLEHGVVRTRAEARARAIDLMRLVGIPSPERRVDDYPHAFSGGMCQRVVIATALACSPEVVLADEPTTALDVTVQDQILKLLTELRRELRLAIVLVTHDMGVVAQTCQRVAVMYSGRFVEVARTEDLFEQPLHPYTAGLLSCVPELDDAFDGGTLSPIRALRLISPIRRRAAASTRAARLRQRNVAPGLFHCRRSPPDASRPVCGTTFWPRATVSRPWHWRSGLHERRSSSAARGREPVEGLRRSWQPHAVAEWRRGRAEGCRFRFLRHPPRARSSAWSASRDRERRRSADRSFASSSHREVAVRFRGEDVLRLSQPKMRRMRRQMQMIFQDPYSSLNPRMSVRAILEEALRVHSMRPEAEIGRRVDELLDLVGLSPSHADRLPRDFSGGQRQRIGIARALSLEPAFIVADEPVSAVDVSVQAQIMNLLLELRDRLDLTMLFIAHDLGVVRYVSTRVLVMYLGRIVESAPRRDLFATPRHPYTQGLLRAAPRADPTRRSAAVAVMGEPPSPLDPPPGCHFHTRCPIASALCREKRPPLAAASADHLVACHHPGSRRCPMERRRRVS